jgi:hypothetical protein
MRSLIALRRSSISPVLQVQFAIPDGQEPVSECSELMGCHVAAVRDLQSSIAVVLIAQDDVYPDVWVGELVEVLLRVGHRFGQADLRRRMREGTERFLGAVGQRACSAAALRDQIAAASRAGGGLRQAWRCGIEGIAIRGFP